MQRFLHDRLGRLETLLGSCNDAMRAYTALDLDIVATTAEFLRQASTGYQQLGDADAESDMLALGAQLSSARSGMHPLTLERITAHRREAERSIVLHALVAGGARLRADFAEARQSLTAAENQLVPILAVAAQRGMVPGSADDPPTQLELEQLWQTLCADAGIRPAARQVAMTVSVTDVLLLISDLLVAADRPR
ncbi:hypothetical protein COUCH_10415 [Couchioplanes caeruleus]|uniref:hypothetical protein n=1 Tax=Couchioplanes caeruleus TaxID=56438 RepID=UPI0020C16E24|nr:hypothetical protein [Couchioplanes caeruleus]UQU66644.1 hypothetical protein COUCH_10415 [Couchioplanes caeruleus]